MSQVVIEFSAASVGTPYGTTPILSTDGAQSEEITSSGTSQATTMTTDRWDVASVMNNGSEDIWITFAATPTAVVGTTHFLAAGERRDFGPLTVGYKAAVINDS